LPEVRAVPWGSAEAVPDGSRDDARRIGRVAVSTRTYIVLAALTGLVILVAFALQVLLVNR
jgi:hypothetical protein